MFPPLPSHVSYPMNTAEFTRDPSHSPTVEVPLGDNTHFQGKISCFFLKNVQKCPSLLEANIPCSPWSLSHRDTVDGLFSHVWGLVHPWLL